jgi:Leucine-rich repeat (LRR) protein
MKQRYFTAAFCACLAMQLQAAPTLELTLNGSVKDVVLTLAPSDTTKTSGLTITWADGSEQVDFTKFRTSFNHTFADASQRVITLSGDLDNIAYLDVSGNGVSALEIKDMAALQTLICNDNSLTTADFAEVPSLTELDISNNLLTDLKGDFLGSLSKLNCAYNNIASLSLTTMPALTWLNCNSNALESLSTTGAPLLERLYCEGATLKTLEVGSSKTLKMLDCANTSVAALDLAGCDSLRELYCNHSMLASLDLTPLTQILFVDAADTPIKSVHFGDNKALAQIILSRSAVDALDISSLTGLNKLIANQSALSVLKASEDQNRVLQRVDVTQSKLRTISFPKYVFLYNLDLSDNEIDSFKVYNYLNSQHIDCRRNRLTFSNLPDYARATIYEYAPQGKIQLPTNQTVGKVDLSRENVMRWGKYTSATGKRELPTFTWYRADGTLVPTDAYSVTNGVTTFASNFADSVYCVIINPNFPDLTGENALRTTTIFVDGATAIKSSLKGSCKIMCGHRQIRIAGIGNGTSISISTLGGSKVAQYKTGYRSGELTCPVAPGLYVVRCTDEAGVVARTVAVKD